MFAAVAASLASAGVAGFVALVRALERDFRECEKVLKG